MGRPTGLDSPAVKRKPIKIDWEELESAFDNRREDLVYYVDLVTGQVVLEGEGEDARDDEDERDEGGEPGNPGRVLKDRLYVDPPGEDAEAGWMAEFVAATGDVAPQVLLELREALQGEDPVEGFREALRNHAPERDRWFLFRSERMREAIDAWLEEHRVITTDRAPWSS